MLKHSQLIRTLHKDFNALQALFIVKMNQHFSEAHMNKFIQQVNLLMHNITLDDRKNFEIFIKILNLLTSVGTKCFNETDLLSNQ